MMQREHMIVRRTRLGHQGVAYVQQRLADRGALARLLASSLPIAAGIVFTYPVANLNEQQILELESGASGGKGTVSVVEGHVREYLARHADALVVMEDDFSDPSDPLFRERPDEPVFFHPGTRVSYDPGNDESGPYGDVYWYLTHLDTAPERVDHVMGWSCGHFFTGVFTRQPDGGARLPHREFVTEGYLRTLASQTRAVILDVYDAEGYLVWVPDAGELEAWPQAGSVRD